MTGKGDDTKLKSQALPGAAFTCYPLPATCPRCARESKDMGADRDSHSPADAKAAGGSAPGGSPPARNVEATAAAP